MPEKRDRIICFSLSATMLAQLQKLAQTKDSMSSLLRQIIKDYLDRQSI